MPWARGLRVRGVVSIGLSVPSSRVVRDIPLALIVLSLHTPHEATAQG